MGTTTKPLDEKPKINKRCSNCNMANPGLTDEDYLKTMLLDQLEPGEEGLGGRLHVVCYPCFLDDDGDNLYAKGKMRSMLRQYATGDAKSDMERHPF